MDGLTARYVDLGKRFTAGGMSEAALYQDANLERNVVVKRLKTTTEQKRLLDEIAALQNMRSQYVVQIYDIVKDLEGNVVGLVEEYVDGSDLLSLPQPRSQNEFLILAFPIARGIADIHQQGHVHRDIKPGNMRIDREGCLKIFDFGLSKGLDNTLSATTIGMVGTPGFMAPELFNASPSGQVAFTPAVDTFAFGVTVLGLVTRDLPAGMKHVPPRLPCVEADFANLDLSLEGEIQRVLNRCLEVDPNLRPRMSEVADILSAYILRGRHKALMVGNGRPYVIDTNNPSAKVSVKGLGGLDIDYDGLRFVISNVSGSVFINNMPARNSGALPGSCVIVLGAPELGSGRIAITIDVSHPEVGR